MFMVLAVLLAFSWVISFFVLHIHSVAVHTLLILAVCFGVLGLGKSRRFRAPAEELPKDAIK
jgi:uncharacterized membrane protein YjjB (DUF3815 family)